MKMRLRVLLSALRTPLLLWTAFGILAFHKAVIPNVVLLATYYSPQKVAYQALDIRTDYLLYLPNAVIFLGAIGAIILLLEVKQLRWPRNDNLGADGITAAIGFGLALCTVLPMANKKPGCLQAAISAGQVAFLWFFFLVNAGLALFHRATENRRWIARCME